MKFEIKRTDKNRNNESLHESNHTIKRLLDKFTSTSNTDTKLKIMMAVLLAMSDEDYFRYDIDDLAR